MTLPKKQRPDLAEGALKNRLQHKSQSILRPAGGSDYSGKVHIWGALPGEWEHWSTIAPLADLLPVVSDPHAVKSPDSKIQGPGKTPSDFNRRGEMRGIHEWTEYHATADDVAKWSGDNRLGVCLQARSIRAIDVDVDDFDEASDIEQFIIERLNYVPPTRRRSNSCKFLMLVDLPGNFTKRRFKTEKGVIEYLATGQQAVIAGTHPSGVRYEWDGGLPAGIPAITAEQFNSLWAALNANFGTEASVEARQCISPTVKRQLADIDDWSFVNHLLETGWASGFLPDGKLSVRCVKEHLHTNESGPTGTVLLPRGLGGIGQRKLVCMHESCGKPTLADLEWESGWSLKGMDEIEDISNEPEQVRIQVRNELREHETTAESRLDRSDTANVNLIHAYSQGRLKYLVERDQWIMWGGSRWEVDTNKNGLQRYCRMVGEHYHTDALQQRKAADSPALPADDRKKLHKVADSIEAWAVQCRNHVKILAMQAQAKMDERFTLPLDKLDTDPHLLGVQNGVVDLRTGGLRPDGREQYVTRRACVEFQPGAEAPRWLRFIEEITAAPIKPGVDTAGGVIPATVGRYTPRPEYARYLQKALGYSLCGLTSEQKMFICYGEGGNGKNIVMDLLQRLAPDYVATAAPALLMVSARGAEADAPSAATASLAGSRMVIASESKAGARLDTAVIKAHTGNKYMRARFLNGNPFTFEVTHKLWLMTNYRPRIDDLDAATRGRLHILPFDMRWNRPGTIRDPSLPDGDKALEKTLWGEAVGVLAWLVQGAAMYFAEGLEPPEAVTNSTAEYFETQDTFKQWLTECCEKCAITDGGKPSDLFAAYAQWCRDDGYKQTHDTQVSFSDGLIKAGHTKEKKSGVVRYSLRLRRDEEPISGMPDETGGDLC